jgi:Zn-dependent protease with chaperone function
MYRNFGPQIGKAAAWLFAAAAALFAGITPAAALTGNARVDAIIERINLASLSSCEEYGPDGKVSPCGGEVSIVKSKRYNAWAKRGKISLTSKMVETSSDDELAYVIAHELAHTVLDHRGGRKQDELAADYWGASMMTRAGFDASAAGTVLARFQSKRRLGFSFALVNTHPSMGRRMREIARAQFDETMLALNSQPMELSLAAPITISAMPI